MAKKEKKTYVMRILDKEKISYETKSYDYDEDDLSGVHAAAELGYDPDMVFKTIVTHGDKTGPVVFCLPSEKEIDLKAAARVSGNKSVEMIHVKELPGLTGYLRGGCSPIGMKKAFPTFIDESCHHHAAISISAGQRGRQVVLSPDDLISLIGAKTADLTAKLIDVSGSANTSSMRVVYDLGVEGTANNLVPNAGEVLDATTAH